MSWRTGRKLGRTIYFRNQLVGVMDTAYCAELIVEHMNRNRIGITATDKTIAMIMGHKK